MALNDSSPDQRDNIISAARAAASWARARRTGWTDRPVAAFAAPPVRARSRTGLDTPAPAVPLPVLVAPLEVGEESTGAVSAAASAAARAAERGRELAASLVRWLPHAVRWVPKAVRWLPHAAAAIVFATVVVSGWQYLRSAAPERPAPVATVAPEPVRPPVVKRKPAGALRVISSPVGAQVFVDGKARGVTPLTIADLAVGRHAVELKSASGTIERTVAVAADKTTDIDESIFSGWLAVYSPFDLAVTEGGRALLMDDRRQIMLPPGRHVLRFVNRALAYDAVRHVDLKPGDVTSLTLAPPPSTVTVTASEAAEVWLNGTQVGATPLNALPVPLGTHEIVVKRASGGERRLTATVTVNPFTVHVDFSRPPS